jgi:hypothetical protein
MICPAGRAGFFFDAIGPPPKEETPHLRGGRVTTNQMMVFDYNRGDKQWIMQDAPGSGADIEGSKARPDAIAPMPDIKGKIPERERNDHQPPIVSLAEKQRRQG